MPRPSLTDMAASKFGCGRKTRATSRRRRGPFSYRSDRLAKFSARRCPKAEAEYTPEAERLSRISERDSLARPRAAGEIHLPAPDPSGATPRKGWPTLP